MINPGFYTDLHKTMQKSINIKRYLLRKDFHLGQILNPKSGRWALIGFQTTAILGLHILTKIHMQLFDLLPHINCTMQLRTIKI